MAEQLLAQVVVAESVWAEDERRHVARVAPFLESRERRAKSGESHPVWDFLFSYYSLRPRQLRRWHPGFGIALAGNSARRFVGRTGYGQSGATVSVTRGYLVSRLDAIEFIARLLRATAGRTPRLNCFGMHEWAMVYRTPALRHDAVPLRLGAAQTDALVESIPLRCSHFDAYRFFTPAATPLNAEALTRDGQAATEQPGCVHAAMDCYKWAYKLGPLVDSTLLVDCLELAADARALDMRASPYDLTAYGFEPITIETAAGRAEYVRLQQEVAQRAAPLRAALLDHCELLLGTARTD
jgi:hypothetical protein